MRLPGVIYGLGNLIENAVDFAHTRVEVTAEWDASAVTVTVTDDGPGFRPEIIDNLGEPYVTTRFEEAKKEAGTAASGMGLGFFIAKSLLERSGAALAFENEKPPRHGAIVRIIWPRRAFDVSPEGAQGTADSPLAIIGGGGS
jgi:two-component system sensor histidine kinase RegB